MLFLPLGFITVFSTVMYRTFLRFWRTVPCGGCTGPSFNERGKGCIRTQTPHLLLFSISEMQLKYSCHGGAMAQLARNLLPQGLLASRLLLWVPCMGIHSSTIAGLPRHLATNPDLSWLSNEHETHGLQHFLLGMRLIPSALLVCFVGHGSWDPATSKLLPGRNLRPIPSLPIMCQLWK